MKDDIYVCAATDGKDGAIMLTHYADLDEGEMKTVRLDLSGISDFTAEVYVTDAERDMALDSKQLFNGADTQLYLNVKLHSTVFIKLIKN